MDKHFIDVVLKLNYLHLNLNYSIFVKLNICIRLVVVLNKRDNYERWPRVIELCEMLIITLRSI